MGGFMTYLSVNVHCPVNCQMSNQSSVKFGWQIGDGVGERHRGGGGERHSGGRGESHSGGGEWRRRGELQGNEEESGGGEETASRSFDS